MLGAAVVTLDLASDRPIAHLVVRLCNLHPSGESLRISYGVLNLSHRDGHEKPALLAIGERYRVGVQLNDAGSVFPAGHRLSSTGKDFLLYGGLRACEGAKEVCRREWNRSIPRDFI